MALIFDRRNNDDADVIRYYQATQLHLLMRV